MKTEITIEELNLAEAPVLIDMRTEDAFLRGTVPGAVNIPLPLEEETELPVIQPVLKYLKKEAISHSQPVYLICHTGKLSLDAADLLIKEGYSARSLKGGYRSWLAAKLREEAAALETAVNIPENGLKNVPENSPGKAAQTGLEKAAQTGLADTYEEGSDNIPVKSLGNKQTNSPVPPRQLQIERSLIKKFRKQLWCRLTKAVRDYKLISEGDKIAVCISGGKDSMLMAKLMQEIQRHGTMKFDIVFLCMNPGYNEENWELIQNNAKILGIPLTTFHTQIFDAVANVDHHPCYLCARMRRGYLYNHAKQLGCNKIALGHHYDDVIETILMGILYAGKTETMMPKLHSRNFPGMELIRPLYLIREEDIKAWCRYNDLHFIQCACRFTETCSVEGGHTGSKRALVKKLIQDLSTEDAYIEQNIFNCVRDINLRTVIGYHKDGVEYHFLDDYEKYDTSD